MKIKFDQSPIHGWGVFATAYIAPGELIESCPVLSLPIPKGEASSLLIDHRFNWPSGEGEWTEQVIALGYGSLYNHSDTPNAYWYSVDDSRVLHFVAGSEIHPGEEIFVYYGDLDYWTDGRQHVALV